MNLVSLLIFSIGLGQAQAALPPTVKPSVLEILSLPEKNREQVARAQKDQGSLADELLKLAFDESQTMPQRWKALHLGAYLKGPLAKSDLTKALKHDQWFMRNAALIAFEKLYPKEVPKVAKSLLQDKALVVRSAAVEVMSRRLDDEGRDLFWDELEKSYNFRNSQSLWVRSQIVEALAKAPEKREKPIFAKLLRDKDTRLHFYSIIALEKLSGKKLGSHRSTLAQKRELWLKAKL